MITFFNIEVNTKMELRRMLSLVYGIGLSRASYLCSMIGLKNPCFIKKLNTYYLRLLNNLIRINYLTGMGLLREYKYNIKILHDLKTYRGIRYSLGLPIHGQRTHSNAKTRKKYFKKYET